VSSFVVARGEPAHLLGLLDPQSDLAQTALATGTAVVQLLEWRDRDLAEASSPPLGNRNREGLGRALLMISPLGSSGTALHRIHHRRAHDHVRRRGQVRQPEPSDLVVLLGRDVRRCSLPIPHQPSTKEHRFFCGP